MHKALAASDGISVGIRPQIVIAASRDLDERKNQNISELLSDTNQQTQLLLQPFLVTGASLNQNIVTNVMHHMYISHWKASCGSSQPKSVGMK